MTVTLRTIRDGRINRILAMGKEKECPLLTFLGTLKERDPDELARVKALLDFSADQGLPKNQEKCRFFPYLQAFELKTRGGIRIMAFWDKNRIVICSHAFWKKSQKTPSEELARVAKARSDYFNAKQVNQVIVE